MRITEKLKSNAGASMSLAMLLLLVCAVIGSVVLTAGTAAAGRLSELSESDKRYYCVESAVGLLTEIIENETPSVSLLKTDEETTVTQIAPDGERTQLSSSVLTSYGTESVLNQTIFEELLSAIRIGTGAIDDGVWRDGAAGDGFTFVRSFKIVPRTYGGTIASMEADVTLSADAYGNLTVTVANADAGDKYTVTMTFKADSSTVLSTEDRNTATTYSNDSDDNVVETAVVTQTTRKTVRLSFKRTDVR